LVINGKLLQQVVVTKEGKLVAVITDDFLAAEKEYDITFVDFSGKTYGCMVENNKGG
jgi:hypothetical protein